MSEQASTEVLTPVLFRDLDPTEQRQRLQEIAVVFLRLGAIAFGGPAAHIAMMEDESRAAAAVARSPAFA